MTAAIGIDLGGTNLRGAVFTDSHEPRATHRELVGDDRDPAAIVERVAAVAERLRGEGGSDGVTPIGVGIAAMLRDRRGTVAVSPHLRWRDVAFGELLAQRLGPRFSLGVYNDVDAITWGEMIAGAARGSTNVLGCFVGTGIGGAVISGGKLLAGAAAGELGHMKVRWDSLAEPCACGGRGCVEAYVGGSYLDRRIQKELASRKKALAVQLAGSIEAVTASHVDEAAGAGDEWALGLWSEIAPLLAVALGNAIALVAPDRLVLGGGLLARTPTLCQLVETALMVVAPTAHLESLEIVMAALGDTAGLVGAAALARSSAT